MMKIDIRTLIAEVEKRPALYDTTLPLYRNIQKKKMLWEQICEVLHTGFAKLDKADKISFGKLVQKKWSSLRDCFRRDLFRQKNDTGSEGERKKYKHFNSLLFVAPYTQARIIPESTRVDTDTETSSNLNGLVIQPKEEFLPTVEKTRTLDYDQEILPVIIGSSSLNETHSDAQPVQEKTIKRDDDDDRLFLLSLLPGMKDFTTDEKYFLRIEIMQTIMKFKQLRRAPEQAATFSEQASMNRTWAQTSQRSFRLATELEGNDTDTDDRD